MGHPQVNSIGQDPRLNQWYTLQGKFKQAYPVERTEGSKGIGTVETPTIDYTSPNLFAGNLTGVNTNIGIGDYQDAQEQAGRKLGGKTIAFA